MLGPVTMQALGPESARSRVSLGTTWVQACAHYTHKTMPFYIVEDMGSIASRRGQNGKSALEALTPAILSIQLALNADIQRLKLYLRARERRI